MRFAVLYPCLVQFTRQSNCANFAVTSGELNEGIVAVKSFIRKSKTGRMVRVNPFKRSDLLRTEVAAAKNTKTEIELTLANIKRVDLLGGVPRLKKTKTPELPPSFKKAIAGDSELVKNLEDELKFLHNQAASSKHSLEFGSIFDAGTKQAFKRVPGTELNVDFGGVFPGGIDIHTHPIPSAFSAEDHLYKLYGMQEISKNHPQLPLPAGGFEVDSAGNSYFSYIAKPELSLQDFQDEYMKHIQELAPKIYQTRMSGEAVFLKNDIVGIDENFLLSHLTNLKLRDSGHIMYDHSLSPYHQSLTKKFQNMLKRGDFDK